MQCRGAIRLALARAMQEYNFNWRPERACVEVDFTVFHCLGAGFGLIFRSYGRFGRYRPLMKKSKFLTRDWRMVEPKKVGQPKAGLKGMKGGLEAWRWLVCLVSRPVGRLVAWIPPLQARKKTPYHKR